MIKVEEHNTDMLTAWQKKLNTEEAKAVLTIGVGIKNNPVMCSILPPNELADFLKQIVNDLENNIRESTHVIPPKTQA